MSIVSYASAAKADVALQVCNNANKEEIKTKVNSLVANGGTMADAGMEQAQGVINTQSRDNAQKVIIFFTDGQPGASGFDDNVANAAITTAKTLENDKKAIIYSVGIFDGADENDLTDRSNKYMNGVSSNYPNATSYTSLGNRVNDTASYYKTAADANKLNNIFTEIFEEVKSGTGFPTDVPQGSDPNRGGFVTFTDTLGQYMEVTDFSTILFAGKEFKNPVKKTQGNIDTYEFTGEANNVLYDKGNLNTIEISVDRSSKLEDGDVVTVKIPASMVPLRQFTVNKDTHGNYNAEVTDTLPIRLFYSAKLKDGVKDKVASPDDVLANYIKDNSSNGKVSFYSNAFDKTKNAKLGSTVVNFVPAKSNGFYYFTEDTILYTDENCTNPLKVKPTLNGNYYYQRTFYTVGNTKPQKVAIKLKDEGLKDLVNAAHVNNDGTYYVPKGTPRVTRVDDTYDAKTDQENVTKTATDVINPKWDYTGSVLDASVVNVFLGNNGRIDVELPGSLEITKKVTSDEGYKAPDKEFTFTLDLTAAQGEELASSYDAVKVSATGNEQKNIKIKDNDTFTLKAGESLKIKNIRKDVTYSVTENKLPAGFTQTAPVQDKNPVAATGKIVAGENAKAEFTNNYSVESVVVPVGGTNLGGSKELRGRTFKEGDHFQFDVKASANSVEGTPLPGQDGIVKLDVTKGSSLIGKSTADINFGNFEFTKPGKYIYSIKEHQPTDKDGDISIPSVSYDSSEYRVSIEVYDNGEGKLALRNLKMEKFNEANPDQWDELYSNADGVFPTEKQIKFVNTYNAKELSLSPAGTKVLANKKLGDYSPSKQFGFKLEAAGSRATGSADEFKADAKQPMPAKNSNNKYVYKNTTTGALAIPDIKYTTSDIGKEYKYTLTEMQPTEDGTYQGKPLEGAVKVGGDNGNWKYKGVTFDKEPKDVIVKISAQKGSSGDEIVAKVDYGQGKTNLVINNSYSARGSFALNGFKYIAGRDFKDGDTFTFNVVAKTKGAPMPQETSVTINPKSGKEADVNFGNIQFTEQDLLDGTPTELESGITGYSKEFVYELTEQGTDANGVHFDTAAKKVVVTAVDNGAGKITTTAKYDGNSDKLAWTNTYNSSFTYGDAEGGLGIVKTMTGRNMNKGEFEFSISGNDSDSTKLLTEADKKFANMSAYDGVKSTINKLTNVKFTQADANKTYSFTVDESDGNKAGVTYDKSQYRVDIKVVDNLDGTMKTVTTVTKTMDKAGDAIAEKDQKPVVFDSSKNEKAIVSFENSYKSKPIEMTTDPVGAEPWFTKILQGREWTKDDIFAFTMTPVGNAPMPEKPSVEVKHSSSVFDSIRNLFKGEGNTDSVTATYEDFGFGKIKFEEPGIYKYTVAEKIPADKDKIPGVEYDQREATVIIKVEENYETGELVIGRSNISIIGGGYFFNTYTAKSVEFDTSTNANAKFTKVLDGRDWTKDDVFNFTITPVDGAPVPLGGLTASVNSENHTFDLGKIKFEKAGTYKYTISEDKGTIPGISYDDKSANLTIVVEDNKAGQLEVVSVSTDKKNNEFKNTYTPEPVSVNPTNSGAKFTKTLEGRDTLAGENFDFTISANDETKDAPLPKNTTASVTDLKDGVAKSFGFDAITFDKVGTYKYNVTETKGTSKGVAYDAHTAVMVVTVTDNPVTGKLVANVSFENDNQAKPVNAFSNSYTAKPIVVDPDGEGDAAGIKYSFTKTLEGRDTMPGEEFSFTIAPVDGAPQPAKTNVSVTNLKDGVAKDFAFGSFTFDKAGTYKYNVTETKGTAKGVTYDGHTAVMTIDVTNNAEDGKLEAFVSFDKKDSNKFNNTYKAESIIVDSKTAGADGNGLFTKTLTGRDTLAGEKFEFTISANDETKDAPLPKNTTVSVTDLKDGVAKSFGFDAITFDKVGTYKYNVTETKGAAKGVTYDSHTAVMIIEVTNNAEAGKLEASVSFDKNGPSAFKNSYTAAQTTVDTETAGAEGKGLFTKQLTGRNLLADEAFNFTLKAATEGAPMPKNEAGEVVTTATVNKLDKNGKADFGFGKITFDKAGTYVYNVVEENAGKTINGLSYASNTAVLEVVVADNDKAGQLTATATVKDSTFVNAYSSDINLGEIGAKFEVNTVLHGRDMAEKQFSYVVKPVDDATAKKLGKRAGTFDSPAANMDAVTLITTISDLSFTHQDAGKTFNFTVDQTENDKKSGYTYDSTVYNVSIKIADNGDGTMKAIAKVNDKEFTWKTGDKVVEPVVLPFVNSYAAATPENAPANVDATKNLNGRKLKVDEFSFVIKNANDTVVREANNQANGSIAFEGLAYNIGELNDMVKNGLATKASIDGKTVFTIPYTAEEVTNNLPAGVTPTVSNFGFEVKVTDNGDGTLAAKTLYPEGGIKFVNTYATGEGGNNIAPLAVAGNKVLSAETGLVPPSIDGKFSFTLTAKEKDAPLPKDVTVTNDKSNNVAFGEMKFNLDMLKDVETNEDGSRSRTFNYTVTESGKVAGITNDANASRTFTVTLKDDGKGHLTATPSESAKFTFTNTYAVSASDPSSITDQIDLTKKLTGRDLVDKEFKFELVDSNNNVVATGTNDANGKITFAEVTYDKPGNFTYKVREVASAEYDGVDYDETELLVNTEVKDNSDGTLSVTHKAISKNLVFNNVYTPKETSVTLGAKKHLTGKALKDGQFKFELKDKNGKVVSTASNDNNGQVVFDEITYDKAGTYKYTISEVNTKEKNIKYDKTSFDVTVRVTDDKKGNLTTEVEQKDNPVFVNTYENPKLPGAGGVNTGDDAPVGLYLSLMLAAGAAATLLKRRKASK